MPAQVVVQVIRGKLKGKSFRFDRRALCLIGRAEDCRIRLPSDRDHRFVSRHHCLLDVDPPRVRVQDFGSRNGTYLNGRKIGQRPLDHRADLVPLDFPECDLTDGDRLRVGKTVFLVRILQPLACAVCGTELPPEAADTGPAGSRVCAACRQAAASAGQPPAVPSCARCGRKLAGPAGPGRPEFLLCLACRQEPRRLAEEMLEKANAGERDLVAIQGYTLLEELGRRHEGAVYLARHAETGQRVALKVLFPRGAADARTRFRFLREAQNTMVLKHPHIVELRDAGWFHGLFFFTLEYCERGTVATLLQQRGGKLSVAEAAPLVLQALEGLDYIHNTEVAFVPHAEGEWNPGLGLVHRDVKPSNLFLTGPENALQAKVGDFGLAKAFDKAGLSGHTLSGLLSGTPYFMPRQQVLNFKYARPEVDVWAMAASFYWMLTGLPPRDFSTGNGWMEVVLESSAVPIRQRLPALPAGLAEVLDAALIDRPEITFKTAAAFKEALLAVL
jgi:serine/threonine-protein kinase